VELTARLFAQAFAQDLARMAAAAQAAALQAQGTVGGADESGTGSGTGGLHALTASPFHVLARSEYVSNAVLGALSAALPNAEDTLARAVAANKGILLLLPPRDAGERPEDRDGRLFATGSEDGCAWAALVLEDCLRLVAQTEMQGAQNDACVAAGCDASAAAASVEASCVRWSPWMRCPEAVARREQGGMEQIALRVGDAGKKVEKSKKGCCHDHKHDHCHSHGPKQPESAPDAAGRDGPATPALPLRVDSRFAWIDPTDPVEDAYPALHEALSRLHALPFELNRKLPKAFLEQPLPGRTLLRQIRVRCDPLPVEANPSDAIKTLTCYPESLRFVSDGSSGTSSSSGDDSDALSSPFKLTTVFSPGAAAAGRAKVRVLLEAAPRSLPIPHPPEAAPAAGLDAPPGVEALDLTDANSQLFYRSRDFKCRLRVDVTPSGEAFHDLFLLYFFTGGEGEAFA
jgi:hypothetical protein